MSGQPFPPLSRARAASCALINLAATPGLGSLIARRYVAGSGQLLLALAGFGLITGWMFELFYRLYLQQVGEPASAHSAGWMGKWGSICFGAAWLWALVTSLSVWRQAGAETSGPVKSTPPPMAERKDKPPIL